MLNSNAGVQAFVFSPPSLPGSGGGLPIQYVLRTIGNPAQVIRDRRAKSREGAVASGRFIVVQNSMTLNHAAARIIIDRDRAAALGVPVSEIGNTLSALVGGAASGKFDRDNRSYDVVTQVPQENPLQSRSGSGSIYRARARMASWCRCLPW